jgi:hypothetical protein
MFSRPAAGAQANAAPACTASTVSYVGVRRSVRQVPAVGVPEGALPSAATKALRERERGLRERARQPLSIVSARRRSGISPLWHHARVHDLARNSGERAVVAGLWANGNPY